MGPRSVRNDLDGRDEAIALARTVSTNAGGVRRIAQRLPDLADGGVHTGLDIDEDVLGPEAGDDVTPRDELTAPLDEEDEQVHRLPLEPYRSALTAQLVGGDVELEVVKPEGLVRFGGRHR